MDKKEIVKPFRLFAKAFSLTKYQMGISLLVLIPITLLLTTILYLAENPVQPKQYTFWNALAWSSTGYLDDPGKIIPFVPRTVLGRLMNVAVAIVKILIFAVPAGLIANGFGIAYEEEKRQKKLEEYGNRLHSAFRRRKANANMPYRTVPAFWSVTSMQAKKGLDTKDIIDVVNKAEDFRLRNLAGSMPIEEQQDRLVVELFPLNKPYGCFIDRRADVTIVCPTAVTEAGCGHFAFHLALFGGFNYVSREVDAHPDAPFSYYNIPKDESEDPFIGQFKADIQSLNSKWVIFVTAAVDRQPMCHFIYGAKRGDTGYDDPGITVKDINAFKAVSAQLAETMKTYDVDSVWSDRAGNSSMYIGRHVGDVNAFTLRLSYKTLLWHPHKMNIALDAAKAILATLEPERQFFEDDKWKKAGDGFAGLIDE